MGCTLLFDFPSVFFTHLQLRKRIFLPRILCKTTFRVRKKIQNRFWSSEWFCSRYMWCTLLFKFSKGVFQSIPSNLCLTTFRSRIIFFPLLLLKYWSERLLKIHARVLHAAFPLCNAAFCQQQFAVSSYNCSATYVSLPLHTDIKISAERNFSEHDKRAALTVTFSSAPLDLGPTQKNSQKNLATAIVGNGNCVRDPWKVLKDLWLCCNCLFLRCKWPPHCARSFFSPQASKIWRFNPEFTQQCPSSRESRIRIRIHL